MCHIEEWSESWTQGVKAVILLGQLCWVWVWVWVRRLSWFRFECLFYCVENDANVAKKWSSHWGAPGPPRQPFEARYPAIFGPERTSEPGYHARIGLNWIGNGPLAPVAFMAQRFYHSITYAIKFKYTRDKNQILLGHSSQLHSPSLLPAPCSLPYCPPKNLILLFRRVRFSFNVVAFIFLFIYIYFYFFFAFFLLFVFPAFSGQWR